MPGKHGRRQLATAGGPILLSARFARNVRELRPMPFDVNTPKSSLIGAILVPLALFSSSIAQGGESLGEHSSVTRVAVDRDEDRVQPLLVVARGKGDAANGSTVRQSS